MSYSKRSAVPLQASAFQAGGIRTLLALVLLAPIITVILTTKAPIPFGTRLLAGFLWMACGMPAWHYLSTPPARRSPFPFFPIIGLLYGLYYALPIALGASNLSPRMWIDPSVHFQAAVKAAFLCWVALLIGSRFWILPKPRRAFQAPTLPINHLARWATVLLLGGTALEVLLATTRVATVFGGLVSFITVLGRFGLVVLVMLWCWGHLRAVQRALTVTALVTLLLVHLGSGLVSTVAVLGAQVGVAYWAANRGRVAWRFVAGAIVFIAALMALKSVTAEYRQIVWWGGGAYGVVERVEVATDLLAERVSDEGMIGTVKEGSEATSQRSAIAEVMADVMHRTPEHIPHWRGETYLSLVGMFIPRFLWPDKPLKNLGQQFGHRYSYLDASDTSTSYNFPWLVEGYANFGWWGVLLVGVVVGLIYRLLYSLVNVPGQGPLATAAGIVLLVPLVNIESDFSLIFGGLWLSGLGLWVVILQLQRGVPR